VKWV